MRVLLVSGSTSTRDCSLVRSSGAGMDVSPHMMASKRASWRKTYCGCVCVVCGVWCVVVCGGEGGGGRGEGEDSTS